MVHRWISTTRDVRSILAAKVILLDHIQAFRDEWVGAVLMVVEELCGGRLTQYGMIVFFFFDCGTQSRHIEISSRRNVGCPGKV